jgi:nicotinate-nucleotide pyrophosphorylase (carboxylating)
MMELSELVRAALAEDVGPGDVTSEAVVPADVRATARIVQKAPGIVVGLVAAREAFRQAGADEFQDLAAEGEWRDGVPVDVAEITGPARAILAAERTALNFLGHLSGIATLTARYVKAVEGTGVTILDTRKTTPGMRNLEKWAVAAGGAMNHRAGLYDEVLLKENHIAIAGGISNAVRKAAETGMTVEVECRTQPEVEEALAAGAGILLLDNMAPEDLRTAVAAARRHPSDGEPVALEASGGVTLDNVAEIAATGVDYISVGALTHSAPALDLSLLVEPEAG